MKPRYRQLFYDIINDNVEDFINEMMANFNPNWGITKEKYLHLIQDKINKELKKKGLKENEYCN